MFQFRGIPLPTDDEEANEIFPPGEYVHGTLVYDDRNRPYIVGKMVEVKMNYVALDYWCPVIPETIEFQCGTLLRWGGDEEE